MSQKYPGAYLGGVANITDALQNLAARMIRELKQRGKFVDVIPTCLRINLRGSQGGSQTL